MAGGFSNYYVNKMLDHLFRGSAGALTITTPAYLRLYTANPDFDTGSGGTEKTGSGGYTTGGQSVAMTSTNWNTAASQGANGGMRVTNKGTSAFSWTASADWSSSITGAALWDANSGGNMLWGKALDANRLAYNGDTIRFAAGALALDLDVSVAAGVSTYWKGKILDHICGTAYSAPATAYVALFTANGNFQSGTWAGFTECAASDYARVAITMNSGSVWGAAASGSLKNLVWNLWSAATNNWGNIVGLGISDGATKGVGWTNFYAGGSMSSVAINPGDTFYVAANNFNATMD